MATCELKQPLLQHEDSFDGRCFENYARHEESSSGYESTDSEAEVPARSHDYKIPTGRQDNEHVSARVKSTHALCESLRLIMEIPEMCDVTFLVGPREIPVHGVRAILGTRSKVLYQLIIKHLNIRETGLKYAKPSPLRHYGDRLTIPVRKYDAEVFRMLMQFVHSGTATISDSTVFGLLCGADQFELKDLEQACWEYMDRRIEFIARWKGRDLHPPSAPPEILTLEPEH
ncbi:serine-enriched protein-like [Mercenaria mercenaria]|uniref:serine-enriched protein-like n=1 Tax=Mercenaria mercenaria TaxID=6596 RepID=UPI00234E8A37|nr:serine-enriched protein-like [Mercenaria mercenaria]